MSRRVAGPGSESGRGKNPAKPMKLRDMKKTGVKDSRTQLKKEKVVEEAMARLQLDEENTTIPKSQPLVKFGGPFKFTVPCEVCGVVGHYNDRCPYIEVGLPDNVTEAPKGYEIVTLRGGKRAVRIMFCGCCKMLRDHKIKDCPNKSKMTAIMKLYSEGCSPSCRSADHRILLMLRIGMLPLFDGLYLVLSWNVAVLFIFFGF